MVQRLRVILVFGLVLGFALPVWAISDTDIRESIDATLKLRRPQETREYWRSLGPAAADIILSMYPERTRIYEKIRLIDALAWYDTPAVTQFLKRLAETDSNEVIKREALASLAIAQGPKEEDFLNQKLKNRDVHSRLAVARALNRFHPTKRGKKMMDRLLANDSTGLISKKLKLKKTDESTQQTATPQYSPIRKKRESVQ